MQNQDFVIVPLDCGCILIYLDKFVEVTSYIKYILSTCFPFCKSQYTGKLIKINFTVKCKLTDRTLLNRSPLVKPDTS